MRAAVLVFILLATHWSNAELLIKEGHVRSPIPGQDTAAAYFLLQNRGDTTCELLAAKSDLAGRVEIHGHDQRDGMVQMRPVAKLPVAPGESLRLESGGYHLMLFHVQIPQEMSDVDIALDFGDCGQVQAILPLRSVAESIDDSGNDGHRRDHQQAGQGGHR